MRTALCAIVIVAAAGCGNEPQLTQPLHSRAQLTTEVQYQIALLPTLGGRLNRPSGISNQGWVAGFANLPGNVTRHAALWRASVITDLGTLGGPRCPECNSSVQWPGLNNTGMIVGISETAALDTLGEEWSCTAFFPTLTGHICRGFVWDNGVITALATFGGDQGFATGVNNRGQVVGWAETPVVDPTCNDPQVLQFRAALWEPRSGTMRELPPLPGDSTSAATAINEKGQAVGISGECDIAVGNFSALHSVLWEKGTVVEIPNLGGDAWHTPMDINEHGEVVGFSNPTGVLGRNFSPHGFLWSRVGGLRDLGVLTGDASSQAVGINDDGQVVGVSSGPGGNRAFLYENGVMKNLNDLVVPGFQHLLIVAQHINDDGVIVGRAVLKGTTTQVPFVATPVVP